MSADAPVTAPAPPSRHPVLELLSRYGAVFKAAWGLRHELAGPRRLADEAAFLPAALSLQDTPLHPAPRRAMWAVMALFGTAVGWSIVGEVDIVAVAPGRIVVSDSTKLIQPLETSVVRAIEVRDGDRVRQGQVLVELDATSVQADQRSVQEQLDAADGEALRSQALLRALDSGTPPEAPALRPADAQLLRAEWADIGAKRAKLDAELAHRQAELATAAEMAAKLEATLPMARKRETDFRTLTAEGFISEHAVQDKTRERVEIERDLASQRARIAEAQAALAESRQSRAAFLTDTHRSLGDRLTQARLKAAQLREEGLKTRHRETLARLVAPVDGTVQQLAVHTAGGVVTPAQALMVIVPDDAQVQAEVLIDNQDIGFVREGQRAEIKLETFNFTRYGTVPAVVRRVARDAVANEKTGAVQFPATLTLQRKNIDVDGRRIALTAGLSVTSEVKTGKRRLIEFLLSPLEKRLQEGARER